jgi:hypothetical protein
MQVSGCASADSRKASGGTHSASWELGAALGDDGAGHGQREEGGGDLHDGGVVVVEDESIGAGWRPGENESREIHGLGMHQQWPLLLNKRTPNITPEPGIPGTAQANGTRPAHPARASATCPTIGRCPHRFQASPGGLDACRHSRRLWPHSVTAEEEATR